MSMKGSVSSKDLINEAWCVGNGQVMSAASMCYEVSQTLNCMHEPMAILVTKMKNDNKELEHKRDNGTWCIGNGQLHDALSPDYEVAKTLNCMDDPMKILVIKDKENE